MASKAAKHVAVYVRVSSTGQELDSQLPELEAWAATQGLPVVWYTDKFTGKTMARPGWQKLEAAYRAGKVATIACWRLDRLGRTAAGLTALFEELVERKVRLCSLRDGFDLGTPAGRLQANILASVAAFETEVRAERQAAGIAAAKAKGKRWGGNTPKHPKGKATAEQVRAIHRLKAEGTPIARIARAVGLSRPTIYKVLAQAETEAA